MSAPPSVPSPSERTQRITIRSVLIGAILVVFISCFSTHMEFRQRSAHMALSNLPMAALVPVALLLLANAGLRMVAPQLMLSAVELLTIFGMVWVGGAIPGIGWIGAWAGNVACPSYYASPENRWREIIFEHLPWWLLPKGDEHAIEWFYNGLPRGESIPWGVWVIPLFWATTGATSLLLIGIGLTVIFQRQWSGYERLTFPLAQVPLDLTEDFDGGDRPPSFLRNELFWAGFAVVALVFLWNIVGYFFPGHLHIGVFDPYWNAYKRRCIRVSRFIRPFSIRLLPSLIGFTYLCNLDLLFSLWFFHLLGLVQLYAMNRTGFSVGLSGQPARPNELIALQSHGAMAFVVIWSIWLARRQLAAILSAAWRGEPRGPGDIISPRAAVAMVGLSAMFALSWLRQLGFSWALAAFWLMLIWTAYFTIMKFLAATGFCYMYPNLGNGILTTFVGTSRMSGSSIAALHIAGNETVFGAWRYPVLPMLPNFAHMMRRCNVRGASVIWIVLLAFGIGVLSSFVYTIMLCYQEGGLSFRTWVLAGGSTRYYRAMANTINASSPTVPDPPKVCVWALGAGLAGLLSVLRARLPWWPLHPVGLVFQYTIGVNIYVTSIFLTWLIKLIVLRVGGMRGYRRSIPFFHGLILGYAVSLALSFAVDMIWFPGQGHYVHGW